MNKWLLRVITLIVTVMSPELRNMLEQLLNTLAEQAEQTSNPWDDILVGLLKSLLLGE